ncbi:MAG: ABC transporter permease [Chloroflexi bacterium]|nr:ABC transporter permease [Chloroflexota bacterium]
MRRYIVQRILLTIPTLLGVATIIFVLMRVVPGDIVLLRYAGEGAFVTQETIVQERARLGLDQPLWRQFADWIWGAAQLDFGTSMWTGRPIVSEVALRFELSLQLAVMAVIIAALVAVPLGVLSAIKAGTSVDYLIRVFSILGLALPSFWVGIVLILLLLSVFHWSPPVTFTPLRVDLGENLSQLIWPALVVGYRYSAVATRMTRSAMLEVLREDYIRTARSKGLKESVVMVRHALRNALLPVITVFGLEFAFLLGGLVVTEQVFNLNGIGKLTVEAVVRRDYTMVQALVLLMASVFVLVNFLVDMAYAWLDPRIRFR